MTSIESAARWLSGCLIAAGVVIGLAIAAILWWLSK